MPAVADVALHFFLQMGLILAAYRLLHPVFRRLGQSQVVTMMITGFLLGPSLFGSLAPALQHWLFPTKISIGGVSVTHPSVMVLYVVGQLGLVCYMFLVGCAFNLKLFSRHAHKAVGTSAAGILVPLVLGGFTGWLLLRSGGYFLGHLHVWQAALFVGSAVSISAFPMLAWIIVDSKLEHTRLGTMALACAAADDAVSWILLAAVVSSVKGSAWTVVEALGGGVIFLVFMCTVGRRLLAELGRRVDRQMEQGETLPVGALITTLIVMLVAAWFTDMVGVYSVFGAFIAGISMPRGRLVELLRERLEPATAYLLLPAFFVYSGLNTKLSLFVSPSTLLMLLLVVAVAFVGKGVAVGLTARLQGMDRHEANSLGALMNARGLMELILLNVGLNAGIVSIRLYSVLAVMAIVTTVAASPLHRYFDRRRQLAQADESALPSVRQQSEAIA